MTEIQIHNPEKTQATAETKPPDVSAKIYEAAQIEVGAGDTARVAARKVENSDFVKSIIPGKTDHDQDERNSAYCYLMHKEGVKDYQNYPIEGQAPLSKETIAKLDQYLKDHPHPMMSVAKVEKEAAELRRQGFPSVHMETDSPAPKAADAPQKPH